VFVPAGGSAGSFCGDGEVVDFGLGFVVGVGEVMTGATVSPAGDAPAASNGWAVGWRFVATGVGAVGIIKTVSQFEG
jgi:hypothetical protein